MKRTAPVVGVACLALGLWAGGSVAKRHRETLETMEDKLAILQHPEDAPRQDLAEYLRLGAECVESDRRSSKCYASVIQAYMFLGSEREAKRAYREARQNGCGEGAARSVAQAWGIADGKVP